MRFIIRNENIRKAAIDELDRLPLDPPNVVTMEEYRAPRSLDQNAYLHAVPLKLICDHTGFSLDDIKDYLLGEAFGWEEKEVFGKVVHRPLRRSSSLNTKEFSWFIEWIEQWAAQNLGVTIPMPNEVL
jgi:hypothetical protein